MSVAAGTQINIDRRLRTLAALDLTIAAGLYTLFGVPLSLPIREAPLGIALTAVVAAQNYWRIDSRNTFRRTFISLNGVPIVIAAFFVSPAWFVVMLVFGPLVAWSLGAAHLWPVTLFNTSSQAIIAVMLAAIAWWIDPTGPLDSPRAILMVAAIWIGRGAVRLVLVYPSVWARYGRFTHAYVLGSLRNLPRLSSLVGVARLAWNRFPLRGEQVRVLAVREEIAPLRALRHVRLLTVPSVAVAT